MISLIEKLLTYINGSAENRAQFFLILGFFVIPFIGLILLFIAVYIFVLK